jgi:chemotaxis protein methyltransferase CheR
VDVTDEDLERVRELVYGRCHLTFPASRQEQLRRWVTACMTTGGFRSFDDYRRSLASDEHEFQRLISRVTTKETYFFRLPEQFEALRDEVLPAVIERESRRSMQTLAKGDPCRPRLHAWSAGCATGQETYSLAMQVLDGIKYPRAWDLTVLGTDIDAGALETARRGRYDRGRFEKVPSSFLDRFFSSNADGTVSVTDEVKAITEFRDLNLKNLEMAASFHGRFDIILCRNVMIYFDYAAQQHLVSALAGCLKPGGFLFTGEGEVLHLYRHGLETLERTNCIFYRKNEE